MASDRNRIEKEAAEGSRSSQVVLGLLRTLSFQLSGAQLGITITAVVLGFIAEPVAASLIEPVIEPFVSESAVAGVSLVLALVLATIFTMVVGELVPKNVAIARPNRTAKLLGAPFKIYSIIATPFIVVTDHTANWLTRRMGIEPAHELKKLPEVEDLEFLVRSSAEEGTLDAGEVELLTRTLRFGSKTADDVMVPRIDIHAVDSETTVAELVTLSSETGKSRFPVIRGDLDTVDSIVHVKSALAIPPEDRESTAVTAISGDVLAVPESRDLVSLMLDMRRRRAQMAVVIDEHGGTAGIVSLEDLLEEIVGEIDDEHDDATELTVVEDDGVYVLSGGLHADEVRDACGFEYPEGDYETLAGFVLDRLQRIPSEGEILRHEGWRIEVFEMDRRRIAALRLSAPASVGWQAAPTTEGGTR